MALYKLSKSKTFHVDYCGCTAAALLLNEQTIRDAIDFIRQVKTKRDFVQTTLTISKDGVKIIYKNGQKFSTVVPSTMIAGSSIGKSTFDDTIGVVYISPLDGQHYPAFIHVYRCDTSRTAQKFLSRLQSYMLIESHRLAIFELEQQLLNRNLLNIDRFNGVKPSKTSTGVSSSSTSNDSQQENVPNPMKSITEELKKKLESQEPILFPPKDYDTIHAAHGHIQRAQAWKSTEPTIVGYSAIDPDDQRTHRHVQTKSPSSTDDHKNKDITEDNNDRSRLTTRQSDPAADPVETVSLAFDFLKDETGSIFADNDGQIEYIENQQQNKPPVYRFRPPQITAMTKKLFPRNTRYELTNNKVPQSNSSSRNDMNVHNNNNQYPHHHHDIQNGHRTPSETRLYHEQQSNMHPSSGYPNRLVNGTSGILLTTNPLWSSSTPLMVGSQPNLYSSQNFVESTPLHRQLSPKLKGRMPFKPVENPIHISYPNDESQMITSKQKKSTPIQHPLNRKQKTQSQYFDTKEFILRASNEQPSRKNIYPDRHISKEYRPHSMNVNDCLLDVYY